MKKKIFAAFFVSVIVLSSININAYARTALAPNVTEEMTKASYWNDRNPNADEVLMSAKEIKALNKKIRALGTELTGFRDLESTEENFSGSKIIAQAKSYRHDRELYIGEKLLDKGWYKKVDANISAANLPEESKIKYGIVTTRTVIKQIPVSDMLSDSPTDPEWDEVCDSALRVGEPIIYYFTTGDGKFSYIKSEIGYGFIPTIDFGICADWNQWIKASTHKDFLVVTGEKIYLEASSAFPESSEKMLTMGTVLELADDRESSTANRLPWNSYVVKLPYRKSDGSLAIGSALVPANRDVNEGYLTMTSRAIVNQAFKCLGNRYGWGGMLKSDDCSQFMMNVYKCFGLEIPRNTTWQANLPTKKTDISEKTVEEKVEILSKMTPGTIIQFPGHEMMFLGVVEGKVYTINDVSSIADPTIEVTDQERLPTTRVRSVIVNEMSSTRRASTMTWLEAATLIIEPFGAE